MKKLIAIFLVLFSVAAFSQTLYSGSIGKYPIQINIHYYPHKDKYAAVYAYDKQDTPLNMDGYMEDKDLILERYEKTPNSRHEKLVESLRLKNFDFKEKQIYGSWIDEVTGKDLTLTLSQTFHTIEPENSDWAEREFLQSTSAKDVYFKIAYKKPQQGKLARASKIKVLEKVTDKILHEFQIDCKLLRMSNISVEDYNFDGLEDFSCFKEEDQNIYFLRDPKTLKYYRSTFLETYLRFDQKKKTIEEVKTLCKDKLDVHFVYKLVNNEMVLIKKFTTSYDPKTDRWVETSFGGCK
ncbi:MAG TPA: hypothetical protein VF691_00250 [Cytophagaceae bacterium]|jgi:hypothetical protein